MTPRAIHPLDRMKPQRGRRFDGPAPVVVVPAVQPQGRLLRLVLATAGSLMVAGGCFLFFAA